MLIVDTVQDLYYSSLDVQLLFCPAECESLCKFTPSPQGPGVHQCHRSNFSTVLTELL